MKKLRLFFVAMLLSAVAVNTYGQSVGSTVTHDGITYTYTSVAENSRTVKVTGIDVTAAGTTEITIPATIKDSEGNFTYKVTTCDFTNSSVTKITLPEGLTTIKRIRCSSLEEVTIPASVTDISSKTNSNGFTDCKNLKNIFVAPGNTKFSDADGVLLTNNGTELFEYPMGRTDTEYTVPSGVTTIKNVNAIQNSSLTSLSFGTDVTTVSASALSLPNVTDVTIPVSLTSISSLTGLSKLQNYHVASGHSTYSDIDGVLFNQDGTTLIGYPIGRKNENYVIPTSTVAIAANACKGVVFNSVDFSQATNLKSIMGSAFHAATYNTTLDLSKTKVENIADYAFYDNKNRLVKGGFYKSSFGIR